MILNPKGSRKITELFQRCSRMHDTREQIPFKSIEQGKSYEQSLYYVIISRQFPWFNSKFLNVKNKDKNKNKNK